MIIKIEIPDYTRESGFKFKWIDNFEIECKVSEDSVLLKANKEGLESLANHLLNLAQESIPSGYHIHLDEYNSLEEDSKELIIEKS